MSHWPITNIHTGPLATGLIARALTTNSVVTSENVQADGHLGALHHLFHELGFQSEAVIPFRLRGKVMGALIVISTEEGLFTDPEDVRLLDEMGVDISFALDIQETEADRQQAEGQIQRQNRRLTVLREIDVAILAADSVDTIVEAAVSHTRGIVGCSRVSLTLIDEAADEAVVLAVSSGIATSVPAGSRVPLAQIKDSIEAMSRNQTIVSSDLLAMVNPPPAIRRLLEEGLRAACSVPLFSHGRLFGMLGMQAETPGFFDEEKVSLGREVANQVAIAVSQQRLVENLRRSEEKFSLLFDKAPFAASLAQLPDGVIVEANEEFEKLVGYPRTEVVGKTSRDLNVYADPEARARMAAEFQQRGFTRNADLAVRNKLGELRHVLVNTDLITIAGQPHLLTTAQDITQRRDAEQRVRYQAHLLDNVNDAIVATDERYLVTTWNLAAEKLYGWTAAEVLGRNAVDLLQTHFGPDELDEAHRQIAEAGQYLGEATQLRKDGKRIPVEIASTVLRDAAGTITDYVGVIRDISARIELQAQFIQAQKMESVGRLAGGVAHDFNNLLTVINGISDLTMMDLRDGDPLRTDLQEIRRAGDRAAMLTRQLLAFSRKQAMQPVVLNLNSVFAGMQSMLQRLIGEDVDLRLEPGDGLGSIRVDPGQIEQVIMNLVVNARDAMPQGGVLTIATRNVQCDDASAGQDPSVAPGPTVMFSLSDTGVGMDQATLARIFEPFFTTKDSGRGTGLGLSTVYGIVEQSGGSIGVYSEVGQGTRFDVSFPRVVDAASAVRPDRASAVRGGTETVLIVDDEEGLRHLAERALKSEGYHVVIAANGGEALVTLERFNGPVHLMITDVVMPGMSGRELADRVRPLRADMKVLYSSGYTDDAILRHGVIDDLAHFISKPYSVENLRRKVREVLDGSAADSSR